MTEKRQRMISCDEIYTFSNYRGISCDIDAICKWK